MATLNDSKRANVPSKNALKIFFLVVLVLVPFFSNFPSAFSNDLCMPDGHITQSGSTAGTPSPIPSSTTETELAEDVCLTDGCYHVFIDAGSNRGVHGRFLFEPEQYPRSKFATTMFPKMFGPGDRKKQNICVLALEPNPRHRHIQRATSSAYSFMGWRYHFLPMAVSDMAGNMTFYTNGDVLEGSAHEDFGFGLKQRGNSESVEVKMVDLVVLLNRYVLCRKTPEPVPENEGLPPRVCIKMDIEGSEFKVMQRLADAGRSGELNVSRIDVMVGEFHPRLAPLTVNKKTFATKQDLKQERARLTDQLVSVGGPEFQRFDDEAYLHDGVPYPQPY